MTSLWIVDREPTRRAALARLAGASAPATSGAPGDAVFDAAPEPEAVLLGLGGDLEAELEFAHRTLQRLGRAGCGWVLLGEGAALGAARRLFDSVAARFLPYPPAAQVLREALAGAAAAREPEPMALSRRSVRDALAARFARSFADLELPQLLRALDPRLADVPVLVLGEPGSGRGTLVRYVHQFGPGGQGAFAELSCSPERAGAELLAEIAAATRAPGSRRGLSLWLDGADRLSPELQRRIARWIEFSLPEEVPGVPLVRWLASAHEPGLDPELRRAAGGLCVPVPPLRERPGAVASLANTLAAHWCSARGLRPRRLGEHALAVLEEYPWPGNLRELEAVVEQSLAASAADPLGPEDLVLDGLAFAPLDAESVGDLVLEEDPLAGASDAELEGEGLELLEELDAPEPEPAPAARLPEPGAAPSGAFGPVANELARLAQAVGHEVRNPLTAVRTFAELLPERHDDPDFRDHFGQLARQSLARVEAVLARLDSVAALAPPKRTGLDVTRLLRELLAERRETVHTRRLLVLEELERDDPHALVDPEQLRVALEALLDKSLELVPEGGDLYLASKRHDAGLGSGPGLRLLLRLRGPESRATTAVPDAAPAANALAFAIADLLIRAQGGALTLDTHDPNETVVLVDLPA